MVLVGVVLVMLGLVLLPLVDVACVNRAAGGYLSQRAPRSAFNSTGKSACETAGYCLLRASGLAESEPCPAIR